MKILAVLPRLVATLAMVALALFLGMHLWHYYMEAPWTRDARVRSEVTQLAGDVSGLISEVRVKDNQQVQRGELLFRIDPVRYRLAVEVAKANLQSSRLLMAQKQRDASRADRLQSAMSQAAKEQAIADADVASANYQQAQVRLAQAKLDLDRTEVRAPCEGFVTNLDLHVGAYLHAGTAVMALVHADGFYVAGYFEETRLAHIQPGARVEIQLMGMHTPLYGTVASIARGIQDRELAGSSGLLANVNPTFQWVRLAQRIPVRIELEPVPADVQLVAGQTASVEILDHQAPASGAKP
jgi:multidrug resistance efflux pump